MQIISTRNIAGLLVAASFAYCATTQVREARAADGTWNGSTSGAWLTPGNWTISVPGTIGISSNNDIASIASGTPNAGSIGIDINAAGGNYSLGGLSLSGAVNTPMQVLNSSATPGTVSLYGATINSEANVILRNGSAAAFLLTNGSGAMNVALANATNNIINIDGTGNVSIANVVKDGVVGAKLLLGGGGSGTLTLLGANTYTGGTTIRRGTLIWNNDKALGDGSVTLKDSSSTGSATLLGTSGGVLLNPILVASDGSGTATIGRSGTSGTTTYNGTITLDRGVSFTNNGATLVLLKAIGGTGSASFDGNGTTVIGANNSYSGGTTINQGTVNVGNGGSTGTILGNVTNDSSMRFNRTDAYTFAGTISGVGNVRSINSGTVTLAAANTYGGGTIIDKGRIVANNTSGSATGTGSVVINNDGTLSGTGSVAGAVQVNAAGHLAAGDPLVSGNRIESLAIGSGLSFVGASHFDYEIQSNAALNVAADAVVVNGNLNISSTASLNLTDLAGISAAIFANGVKLTLISYSGTWNGTTFASMPNGSLVTLGPNQFTLSYNDSARGLNFTTDVANGLKYVTLTSIAAVPEASVIVFGGLLCLTIGGVTAARKRLGRLDAADASAKSCFRQSP